MPFEKGYKMSNETKQKIRETMKNKKGQKAHMLKIGKSTRFCKGHQHSKEVLEKISKTNTGHIVSEATKQKIRETNIKIGRIPPSNYGKFKEEVGEKIELRSSTYTAIHQWVVREKGNPSKCEHCKTTEAKRFDWANTDHKYKRNLDDYIRLCVKCHRKYDKENN